MAPQSYIEPELRELKATWTRALSPPTNEFGQPYVRIKELQSSNNGLIELWQTQWCKTRVVVKIGCRAPEAKHNRRFIQTLKEENHPCIIQIFKFEPCFPVWGQDRTIMEYCNGGDLFCFFDRWERRFDRMQASMPEEEYEQKRLIPETFIFHVLYQVSRALAFLHSGVGRKDTENPWNPIVHRDIKPENILLHHGPNAETNDFPTIKIVDLDFADEYTPEPPSRLVGTDEWMAPEVRKRSRRNLMTPAADVWSLGAVALNLAAGCYPKETFCPSGVWKGVPLDPFESLVPFRSTLLNNWLCRTLNYFPERRDSAESIMTAMEFWHNTQEYRDLKEKTTIPSWAWKINTDVGGGCRSGDDLQSTGHSTVNSQDTGHYDCRTPGDNSFTRTSSRTEDIQQSAFISMMKLEETDWPTPAILGQ